MKVTVEVKGSKRIQRNMRRARKQVLDDLEATMSAVGQLVRSTAIRGIQKGPKTGRLYTRRGIAHRASAPGEYPASDTGRLVNSIRAQVRRKGQNVDALIGASTDYAKMLEFGTRRMRKRPFLKPSIRKNRKNIRKLVSGDVKVSLVKSLKKR